MHPVVDRGAPPPTAALTAAVACASAISPPRAGQTSACRRGCRSRPAASPRVVADRLQPVTRNASANAAMLMPPTTDRTPTLGLRSTSGACGSHIVRDLRRPSGGTLVKLNQLWKGVRTSRAAVRSPAPRRKWARGAPVDSADCDACRATSRNHTGPGQIRVRRARDHRRRRRGDTGSGGTSTSVKSSPGPAADTPRAETPAASTPNRRTGDPRRAARAGRPGAGTWRCTASSWSARSG